MVLNDARLNQVLFLEVSLTLYMHYVCTHNTHIKRTFQPRLCTAVLYSLEILGQIKDLFINHIKKGSNLTLNIDKLFFIYNNLICLFFHTRIHLIVLRYPPY